MAKPTSHPDPDPHCGKMQVRIKNTDICDKYFFTSVADPDPDILGQPGSGSGPISMKYGSGSLDYHAKIVRKPLIPTVL
jgi:hypothetical protein